jgi:hypothetical protein
MRIDRAQHVPGLLKAFDFGGAGRAAAKVVGNLLRDIRQQGAG